MTYLIAEPEIMTAVGAAVEQIDSAISAANAAAAGPTSGVIAPAADEVSAAITKLFGQFGQPNQALVAQAATFHSRFAQALAAGGAYAAAEATASNLLAGSGAAAAAPLESSATSAMTDPAVSVALGCFRQRTSSMPP
jgi:hypothetical protein